MVTYTTYENYGNTPLWRQIMLMYPDVPEEHARAWSEHCARFETDHGKGVSRAYLCMKYVREERKKLLYN